MAGRSVRSVLERLRPTLGVVALRSEATNELLGAAGELLRATNELLGAADELLGGGAVA